MPRLTFTNILGADIAVGNSDGYGKTFTILAAGSSVDLSDQQLESAASQLDAIKTKGYVTWTMTGAPSADTDSDIPHVRAISSGAVAAKSTTAIHAAVFGDAVGPVTITTALTNPVTPRIASAVAGATYDGGTVTLTGTDQFDSAQTDSIIPVAGTTVFGTKIFKTVTSVAYPGGGVGTHGTNTLSIGTGDKIGVPYNILNSVAVLLVGAVPEAVTIDVANDAFTPTTVPSATTYTLLVNVAS